MKIVAIVQARMGSTRLPGKVLKPVCGEPLIGLLLKRLCKSRNINKIVLATSDGAENTPLINYVEDIGYEVYVGSELDVLDRFYQAALGEKADAIVRITGDCPLIDPTLIDEVIAKYLESNADYASNVEPPTFPDGLDTEIFSFRALELAWNEAKKDEEREHVTPYLRFDGQFSRAHLVHSSDESSKRWTVDEEEDFDVVEGIFNYFYPRLDFSWKEVMELYETKPDIFKMNMHLKRNEGEKIGKGQKLWKRAKRVIPGGNMLLSKRAEMFLPDYWPAYFSKTEGCYVWDLDDVKYLDMSIMGVGTNTLGYSHPEVDDAVRKVVSMGNMSTLNAAEEVYLAEKLMELHPWADMARFARTGGEANAIAIRIARAASGRDKIAICGYHGWHDWYLAANLGDGQNLDGHLLPGLEPKGVPGNLRGSVLPFHYNNFPELSELVKNHSIGAIKMEVSRNTGPEDDFLAKVRKLADENNIILIFDECTSGFRQSYGGLHKLYGVQPDMAIFGKALGNGYAITATIGKREIMDSAQNTFISSTFWTERIGLAAALKTLDIMEREKSWEKITETGRNISKGWQELADKYGLPIEIYGLPALTGFTFKLDNAQKYKTLLTQEMLKSGILASDSVYVCTEHTPELVLHYFEALESVFSRISDCENGQFIDSLLDGSVSHSGFRRLN